MTTAEDDDSGSDVVSQEDHAGQMMDSTTSMAWFMDDDGKSVPAQDRQKRLPD